MVRLSRKQVIKWLILHMGWSDMKKVGVKYEFGFYFLLNWYFFKVIRIIVEWILKIMIRLTNFQIRFCVETRVNKILRSKGIN